MKKVTIFLIFFVAAFAVLFITQSTVSSVNESLWLTEYVVAGHAFQLVDILIGAIGTFVSIMIVLLGIILVGRRKREIREKIKADLTVKYQDLVMSYLESVEGTFIELKTLAKSKFRKQLLAEQIIDIAKNLRGDNLDNIQILYRALKLDKRAVRQIKYGHWHNKIKGIKEICALSLPNPPSEILKYAHSKNDILRMEAQTALVELSRFDENANPFEFLDELTVPFSLWEQIALHQVMLDREITPPDFKRWLFSDNYTVILFCLRMIREYKQTFNAEWVKDLAWHDREDIRLLAYEVMGDLKMVPELKEVRKLFKDENIYNKREMIRSMRKSADPKFIGFLKKVIDNEEDAEILVEGIRGINESGKEGTKVLNKMLKDTYKNYNIVIKHVKDRRII